MYKLTATCHTEIRCQLFLFYCTARRSTIFLFHLLHIISRRNLYQFSNW